VFYTYKFCVCIYIYMFFVLFAFLVSVCKAHSEVEICEAASNISGTPNFPHPMWEAPGIFTRCNLNVSCKPYSCRPHLSFDWLCCEYVKGSVALHTIHVGLVRLMIGDFWNTWLAAFLFEVGEALSLAIFQKFLVFPTVDLNLETLLGSLIGDAFIEGFIGAFMVSVMCWITGYITPWQRVIQMRTWSMRLKYFFLYLMLGATTPLISVQGVDQGFDSYLGITVSIGTLLILVWAVYIPLTSFPVDVDRVWGSPRGLAIRNKTFFIWTITSILVLSQSCGFFWLANDWFQVWVVSFLIIFVLLLVWWHQIK